MPAITTPVNAKSSAGVVKSIPRHLVVKHVTATTGVYKPYMPTEPFNFRNADGIQLMIPNYNPGSGGPSEPTVPTTGQLWPRGG